MHTLKEFRGKKVVLYFYTKDNTSECTKQACAYNGLLAAFAENNTVVVGISKDTIASHKKFEKDFGLKFTILSDPEHKVIEIYDVWKEKKNYGRIYTSTQRTAYLIDERGVILYANDKVKPTEDAELILCL